MKMVAGVGAISYSALVLSAPGAHGPNGEHLDVDPQVHQAQRPTFESFTESFELLGEVFVDRVKVYLHDFPTNTPVADASVELESGSLSAQAGFSDEQQHYVIRDETFVAKLNQPGEHEIVITILTEESGDLLASTLLTPEAASEAEQEAAHHHGVSWTMVVIALLCFAGGLVVGRLRWGKKQ
ncbi:hypothetical protein OCL06_12480 [Alteromonas sp. ASW11-19]|uniref:Uncharacterized protein n=1 Tax=Alteromonas salexigens TaxID=2982530 RepID=A0ABT2VU69_9ALTE|nr:hypothetical protein [Alteromonas salexigens]MCU7555404.1 hypothetical protein [Alteromonas salexigens]